MSLFKMLPLTVTAAGSLCVYRLSTRQRHI